MKDQVEGIDIINEPGTYLALVRSVKDPSHIGMLYGQSPDEDHLFMFPDSDFMTDNGLMPAQDMIAMFLLNTREISEYEKEFMQDFISWRRHGNN